MQESKYMELVPIRIEHGEEKAWDNVCGLPRDDVCKRTGAVFDEEAGAYILKCFGMDFLINPCDLLISTRDERGGIFLDKLKYFFRLSVLNYLSTAKDIPPSGILKKPLDLRGGHRFFQGTHQLPLDRVAERFGKDREGFIRQGRLYGADVHEGYGDASIVLYPFPRVPVTMILWLEDEEFPASVDLLFDSTCEFQISLSDIIWAIAMMCTLLMLEEKG